MAAAPPPDWRLPEVVDIQIRRIAFKPHKLRHFESALKQFKEAIEFTVKTSGPIPARALGPALFIGETPVVECITVGKEKATFRFLAFHPNTLRAGAPISWGWSNAQEKQRHATKFRYSAP